MPDPLNEIPLVIITVMAMFILLIAVGAFLIVRYQKKKFQYQQSIFEIQKEHEAAILQSQLEIQEQTFEAISQEIHDNVGQILSLAKVQLNIAESSLSDPKGVLAMAKESIGRAMTDLRDIAKSLSSDRVSQMDLVQAIRQETERINKTRFLVCTLEVTGETPVLGAARRLVVFRTVQEILNNILKHSGASQAIIAILFDQQQLQIQITDNGKGFDAVNNTRNGLGLQNITKRTVMIGGEAIIGSAIGKGTTIQLNIPYE
ncbi:sensor histidine kinase [Asinibacterium sp. OR53]|uniref:sensor histidine kinase n=1 Tax=Asinibacterium sp. OR53 TaxID=925409 RepID=UPI00047EAE43|nr:ATP-binding protein [Asinibacterium sp. OR53]